MPTWERIFGRLLNRRSTTHECSATYLSCSAFGAGFGPPEPALAAYPGYVLLADQLNDFLTPVASGQRRALAVTAQTQAGAQTPILGSQSHVGPRGRADEELR